MASPMRRARRACAAVDLTGTAISMIGTSSFLDPIDVAVRDSHTVAHAQVEVARVFDDQRAARIESHGDAVSRRLPPLFVDFVSDDLMPAFRSTVARVICRRPMWTHLRGNPPRSGRRTVKISSGFVGLAQFACEGSSTECRPIAHDSDANPKLSSGRCIVGRGASRKRYAPIPQTFSELSFRSKAGVLRRRGGPIRPVDSSLHDEEHGERDDGAYQDAGKKISRLEQGPQVIPVDRYRPRGFALRWRLPRKERPRAHV
jgi:hypothetical protein